MKTLVIIPTYNETQSIKEVILGLLGLTADLEILVVDDNSPDGTAQTVKSIGSPRIHLLARETKAGLGAAYRAGFQWAALSPNFTHYVTMDGDGSHRYQDLPAMLERAKNADVVMGSRWMPGGSIENWPKYRQWISRVGTSYARRALKLPLSDLTGGFRVYSTQLLKRLRLQAVSSDGYCFQIEMVRAAHSAGATFAESPISFVEREQGESKMSRKIVAEALIRVSIWGLQTRFVINADKLHYVK